MKYSGRLTYTSFWFLESKKMAELILDDFNKKDIIKLSLEENIFQVNSEKRKKEMATNLFMRLNNFSKDLLERFLTVDVDSARIFVLISILKTDLLFFEFIREVFREKMIVGNNKLDEVDFTIFFENKAMQSETVENWSDGTIERLKKAYKNIMRESNLLNENNELSIPIIDFTFKDMLIEENCGPFIDSIFV